MPEVEKKEEEACPSPLAAAGSAGLCRGVGRVGKREATARCGDEGTSRHATN